MNSIANSSTATAALAQTRVPVSQALGLDDLAACRALMRGGSKSFFAASLLLPARLRAPATALYAFCRLADDAIDEGSDPAAAMKLLEHRLDAIYAGRPDAVDADRALAHVVHRYGLPRTLPDALLDGFMWDAQGRRYYTLEDVEAYGARVAGTVGAMMSLIMGACTETALARACELGVAMQLTNIARDIGEDARNARLYIPRNWFLEAGMDADAWLRQPVFDARIAGFTKRLLERADVLYARGECGLSELTWDCRPAIAAARLVYAEIGRQLERDGLNAVDHRTVVSKRRKLVLIAKATAFAINAPESATALEPLPAIAYLVDAVAAAYGPAGRSGRWRMPQRNFEQRVEWMVDLFGRLEERDKWVR